MKQISLLLLAIVVLFASCDDTKNNPVTIGSQLQAEYFIINANTDTVIKSRSGVAVSIAKDVFADSAGKLVSGPVRIELKEALSPTDIILAHLTTTSNAALLQTGGMIYFNAEAGGRSLAIAPGRSVMVTVPADTVKKDMQLFTGVVSDSGINWISPLPLLTKQAWADSLLTDCIECCDTAETILQETYAGCTAAETPTRFKENRTRINKFIQDDKAVYVFELKKLGWANIDRFWKDPQAENILLDITLHSSLDYENISATLVLDGCYVPGYQTMNGRISFSHNDSEPMILPIGANATIVIIANRGNKLSYAIEKITISKTRVVNMQLVSTNNESLRKTLIEQL